MGILPNSTRGGGDSVCLSVCGCMYVCVYARVCALDMHTQTLGPTYRNTGVLTHRNIGSIYCSLYAKLRNEFRNIFKRKDP